MASIENMIAASVWKACLEVHRTLGPNLLEKIYEDCVIIELQKLGHEVRQQAAVPFYYKGQRLTRTYYIDTLVDEHVVLEFKVVSQLLPVHKAQLLSYLRLTGLRLGLLINFGAPLMVDGFRRVANGLED